MSVWCYFDFEADENIKRNEWTFKSPSKTLWRVKEEWIMDPKKRRTEDQSKDDREIYHKITISSIETISYYAVVNIHDADPAIEKLALECCIDFHLTNIVRCTFSRYKEHFFRGEIPIKLTCSVTLYPLFFPDYVPPTCLSEPEICHSIPFAKFASVEAIKNLSRDMGSLLEKGTLTDMSLVCESTEVKVHKNILKVRAPCFMMVIRKTRLKNMENQKVSVDDMDLVVLRQMLSFVYTGKVTSKDVSVIRRLHTVADDYDMQEMEKMCDTLLSKLRSPEVHDDGI